MTRHSIYIEADGTAQAIYSDDLAEVARDLGTVETSRASHVEPCGTGWAADLSPVGGPVLGPFVTRGEALAEEVAWLDAHLGRAPLVKQ